MAMLSTCLAVGDSGPLVLGTLWWGCGGATIPHYGFVQPRPILPRYFRRKGSSQRNAQAKAISKLFGIHDGCMYEH